MRTTLGEQMPLGFERLKICELFAELLHCSNMSNLNGEENEAEEDEDDKDEESIKESDDVKSEDKQEPDTTKDASTTADGTTIGDYLKMQFVENRVMPTCVVSVIIYLVCESAAFINNVDIGSILCLPMEQLFALCDLRHVASDL